MAIRKYTIEFAPRVEKQLKLIPEHIRKQIFTELNRYRLILALKT